MHFLILCILSSTSIFVIFRSIERFKLPSFPVIILNYFFAAILGFLVHPIDFSTNSLLKNDWFLISLLIGILFILMFFLIARSSQNAGISVTTIASKMSVVFPIILSLIISPTDKLTTIKALGVLFALIGVVLTIIKPGEKNFDYKKIYLPLILFVGMGFVDSLVKYAQHLYVGDEDVALFSAVLFFNAFATGVIILLFKPKYFIWFKRKKTWGWGLLLGIVNFGSIFFLVRSLNFIGSSGLRFDSSIVFGINNIGIVSLSVMAGLLIFKERLKSINWIGIAISAIAIILFTLS